MNGESRSEMAKQFIRRVVKYTSKSGEVKTYHYYYDKKTMKRVSAKEYASERTSAVRKSLTLQEAKDYMDYLSVPYEDKLQIINEYQRSGKTYTKGGIDKILNNISETKAENFLRQLGYSPAEFEQEFGYKPSEGKFIPAGNGVYEFKPNRKAPSMFFIWDYDRGIQTV